MQTVDLVRVFTDPLQKSQIPYMVTGSIACVIYGEPRLTHDVDLVAEISESNVQTLQDCFPEDQFYCPPKETLLQETKRTKGSFNLIHQSTGFKADFYLVGQDPLHLWAMKRKKQIDLGDHEISVAPEAYVMIRKLEYYREGGSDKHLGDIRGILRNDENLQNDSELIRWIETKGLQSQWDEVLKQTT